MTVTVSSSALRDRVRDALGRRAERPAGSDVPVAAVDRAARWVVETEQLGLSAFGVGMLLREFDRLDAAGPSVGAPSSDAPTTGTLSTDTLSTDAPHMIDAAYLPGSLALAEAVEQILAATPQAVSAVGVRDVGGLGVIGLAARDLAARGLVGVVAANAPAIVAPWGGTAAAIGTNPLAIAAPRADAPPLVLDYATSPLTMAELRGAAAVGETVDDPGGFTADGTATRAAGEIRTIAPSGRLGSLAALTVELLATAVGPATGMLDGTPGRRSALVIALNPALLGGRDAAAHISAVADRWRAAGGHLPRRFDALDTVSADAPVALPEALWKEIAQ